ncbi:MAG: hypothetical protein ACI38Q_01120 [Candidatus Bruticola sp.]
MGRTEIYACGEYVSRRCSSKPTVLSSMKQESPASIGGSTFTHLVGGLTLPSRMGVRQASFLV